MLAVLLSGSALKADAIPGDVNGDGIYDRNDIPAFLYSWRNGHPGNVPTAATSLLDVFLTTPQPSPTPAYRLYALDFSPYTHGNPGNGDQIPVSEIQWLIDGAAPYCHRLRTFGSTGTLSAAAPYAKSLGLGVWAAAWLTNDTAANESEIAALLGLIAGGYVDLAIVGTETLYRGNLSSSDLISYINRVKGHGVPVTTNDTWSELLNHTDVMAACDVVMANFYPYWEGISCDRAVAAVNHDYDLLAAASGKPIYVGEVGWPSAGAVKDSSVPSPANAAAFFLNVVSWARARSVPGAYFEMVDEPWKAVSEGEVGAHWGLWESTPAGLRLKADMIRPFRGDTVADNWSNYVLPGPVGVQFTHVPAYGSTTDFNLLGTVSGVDPSQYDIAVYIYVFGWWNKPTFAQPKTAINPDGTWSCDIDTGRFGGGEDELATVISAFLIPAGYTPPKAEADATLDPTLLATAVASHSVNRSP